MDVLLSCVVDNQVKPDNKLEFVASPLSTQHEGART